MKIIVAGLRIGLPSQNASDVPTEQPLLRSPSATGAAQQVHIIPGVERSPASATRLNFVLPKSRRSQSLGTSACTPAPRRSPSTIACQIDFPYAHAYPSAASTDGGGGIASFPETIEAPMECCEAATKVRW